MPIYKCCLTLLAAMAALSACGKQSSSSDVDARAINTKPDASEKAPPVTAPTPTPEAYYTTTISAFCARRFGVCKSAMPDASLEADVAECAKMRLAYYHGAAANFAEVEATIAGGTVGWPKPDVAYCMSKQLEHIEGLPCDKLNADGLKPPPGEARCAAVGRGLVQDGGTCAHDVECAGANSTCSDTRCSAAPAEGY